MYISQRVFLVELKHFKSFNICFSPVGICGIAGVSIFANLIVVNFNFTTYSSGVGFGGGGGFGGIGGGGFGNTLTPR